MTVRTPGSGAEAAVWSDYHRARRRAARRCIGHGSTQERSYSVLRCRRRRRRRRARRSEESSSKLFCPIRAVRHRSSCSKAKLCDSGDLCGDTLCGP